MYSKGIAKLGQIWDRFGTDMGQNWDKNPMIVIYPTIYYAHYTRERARKELSNNYQITIKQSKMR